MISHDDRGTAASDDRPHTAKAVEHSSEPPASTPRSVWIIVFMLTAVIVGGAAGLLTHAGGTPVPGALLAGGAAFAGTLALLLAVAHYAHGK